MPIERRNGSFVQFKYEPDYLKDLEKYRTDADIVIKASRLEDLNIKHIPLNVDGGNVVVCEGTSTLITPNNIAKKPHNYVIMTDKVLKENPQMRDLNHIDSFLKSEAFGQDTTIVWLPWDEDEEDKCGHTDGIVHFISQDDDGRPSVLANLNWYPDAIAKNMRKSLNKHFNVIDLKLSEHHDKSWAYINFLQTKDIIIVPGLGKKTDQEALYQIRELYPSYKDRIYMVNIEKIVKRWGGALNCLTWTIK